MTIQQHASFDSSAAELNATSKLVKAWESKNAKNAARAGGVSLMALSLAACGGSSETTDTTPFAQADIDAAVLAANTAAAAEATAAATAAAAAEAAAVAAAEAAATTAAEAASAAEIAAANAAKTTAEAAAATAATAQAAAEADAATAATAQAAAEADAATAATAQAAAEADAATAATAQAAAETAKVAAEAAKVAAENATAIATTAQETAEAALATLQTTYDELNAAYDLLVNPIALNQFLTTGTDNVAGTANADTVSATYNNDGTDDTGTLNVSDSINLGDEADTMVVVAYDEMTAALVPVLNGVETVSIQNAVAGIGAHEGLSSWGSDATSFIVKGVQNTELNDLDYDSQTVTLSNTTGTITLDGAGDEASVVLSGGSVDSVLAVETATSLTLDVAAASTLGDISDNDLTSLTITGAGAFTLEDAATEDFATITASGNTGGVTLQTVDYAATSIVGTAANDRIEGTDSLDNASDDVTIDGGDGSDTLQINANVTDGAGVTNIEIVELATSGLEYVSGDIASATQLVIATPGADNGGATADTAEVSSYDGSETITISDANVADDTEADTIALTIDAADDYTDATSVSIVTTQDGGDDANAYTVADINVEAEAGGDAVESLTISVSGTRGVDITNIDVSDNTSIVNVSSSVAIAVADVDHATETAGDDLGNTVSFAASTGAVTYTVAGLAYNMDEDDVITGGSGSTDTLIFDLEDDDVSATITGFETIQIVDADEGTLDLSNSSGYTTIEFDAVTTDETSVTNVASGTTVAVTEEGSDVLAVNAASAGASLSVTYTDADEYDGGDTLSFGANVSTVSVAVDEDDTDVDQIDMAFAGNNTLNITGDDSTDDVLALVLDQAATVTSVAINSTAAVQYDASADTLDDDINLTFAGSTGAVNFTVTAAQLDTADSTFTGGSGSSDAIAFDASNVDVDAGTISGFETVTVTDANAGTVDMAAFAGETAISLDADTGGITLENVESGSTITLEDGAATQAVAIDSDDADADGNSLTIVLSTADTTDLDDVTVTDFETVTIESDVDQTALDLTTSDAEVDTVVFTGTGSLTFAAGSDVSGAENITFTEYSGTFVGALGTTTTTTITLDADMTVGADLTLLVDTGGNAGEFVVDGATAAAANIDLASGKETVVFGATMDNDVVLDAFEVGVTGDVLDLSNLGVTGTGDLTFTQFDDITDATTAGDDFAAVDSVQITSTSFDGEIYLSGVLTADLTADNFIFA